MQSSSSLRHFSQQLNQSRHNYLSMEKQIKESLAKLEMLSHLVPKEDPRTAKAKQDYAELNEKFGQLVFQEDEQAAMSADEEMTEEIAER